MATTTLNHGRWTQHLRKLPDDADGFVSSREAADFLGVTLGTLAQWRHHNRYALHAFRLGGGKRGGRCYYRRRDLVAFMEKWRIPRSEGENPAR